MDDARGSSGNRPQPADAHPPRSHQKPPMNQIIVKDLAVQYRVGVPDAEREHPQKLLITLVMDYDFIAAAKKDDICGTVDYSLVTQHLLRLGERRSWKLIETL